MLTKLFKGTPISVLPYIPLYCCQRNTHHLLNLCNAHALLLKLCNVFTTDQVPKESRCANWVYLIV